MLYTVAPIVCAAECVLTSKFPRWKVDFQEGIILCDERTAQSLLLEVAIVHKMEPEEFCFVAVSHVLLAVMNLGPHLWISYRDISARDVLSITDLEGREVIGQTAILDKWMRDHLDAPT